MSLPRVVHVLVGTSPSDAARSDELHARARRLDAQAAFLQLAEPSLVTVLDRCASTGVDRVVLVGVSSGPDGPGVSWLRRVAAAWWVTRAGSAPAPEIRTAPTFLDADASWQELVARATPVRERGAGLTSPAWEDVPCHRHQVLVCRGPRCTAAGAERTMRALVLALLEAGLGDDDVLLTHTGCLSPCNKAPVVAVQPDDVWYGGVDAPAAAEVVAEHLLADRPVPRLRLPRRPQ